MFPVDGNPLPGQHAGRTPDPEAEEVPDNGVQVNRPMRLVPVQVESYRHHRDLHHDECR